MEISLTNTFYNLNKHTMTISKREIKFLNVLDKSIANFSLDKYVYVTPSIANILTNKDNDHIFTLENFGHLTELIKFVLENDHQEYKQTRQIKMIAVIDFKDFKALKEEVIFDILNILNWSNLQYPIRFFFYTDNIAAYKDEFWFETIKTCVEDYAIGPLEEDDKAYLLNEKLITEETIKSLKENSLVFKSSS